MSWASNMARDMGAPENLMASDTGEGVVVGYLAACGYLRNLKEKGYRTKFVPDSNGEFEHTLVRSKGSARKGIAIYLTNEDLEEDEALVLHWDLDYEERRRESYELQAYAFSKGLII